MTEQLTLYFQFIFWLTLYLIIYSFLLNVLFMDFSHIKFSPSISLDLCKSFSVHPVSFPMVLPYKHYLFLSSRASSVFIVFPYEFCEMKGMRLRGTLFTFCVHFLVHFQKLRLSVMYSKFRWPLTYHGYLPSFMR